MRTKEGGPMSTNAIAPHRRRIEFAVSYTADPKQGDRSRIAQTRSGKQYVQHHPDPEVKLNAAVLAALFAPHVPAVPFRGPLRLVAVFCYAWLASATKRQITKGRIPKETKPDLDNLAKQIGDVMERSGFCKNDAQIADLTVRKFWTHAPSVEIVLEEMT